MYTSLHTDQLKDRQKISHFQMEIQVIFFVLMNSKAEPEPKYEHNNFVPFKQNDMFI